MCLGQGVCDVYINKYKIRQAMQIKGISTQTELANLLGITKNQLSVILSERFEPIKSNVKHLCDFLDVSPLSVIAEEQEAYQIQLDDIILDNSRDPIEFKHNNPTSKISYIYKQKQQNNQHSVRVLELFAGAGGLALGLEKAGLSTVALIEINKKCCETLRANKPNWNVLNEDVCDIDFSQFNVDVVTGGFPCQAFSYAGKKLGFEDTRGTLFYQFARCIKETKPLLFMAENVRGLISHDKGRTLKTIINILEGLGYNVKYRLLNAVNYGIPQKRERVVIIGTLPGIKFDFPKRESLIKTLRDALKDVPLEEGTQYSTNKKKVLDLVPPGGCWRHLPPDVQKSYMGKSLYSGGGRTGMARRISWDEPCLTLTCSPSQKQTERCHPDETRPFTVREYARIQTFPDDWQFIGSVGDKYKQIGNAVPVELAFKLGLQIQEAIQLYKSKLELESSG